MGNARIWEGTLTYTEGGQTRKENVRLINQSSSDITDQTPDMHKSFWVYTGQTAQSTCISDLYFISGQTVTTEEVKRVDYNKRPIRVVYYHMENGIVIDEIVEYDDVDVPFYDLVERYILASEQGGYYGYVAVRFEYRDNDNGETAVAHTCGWDNTPQEVADVMKRSVMGNMTLYDFQSESFSSSARGKTIYIRETTYLC